MYSIPLFDLNYDSQEELAMLETLRSKWISAGPKTAEFESMFAKKLSVSHALATANCTVALHLAMKLLDIGQGDEVICPSLTFVATANAIKYVDAVPVFCDISSLDDLTINPSLFEKLLTKKTKAIMVMHYGGFACNMDAIVSFAQQHNLRIIEDACHGPSSTYHNQALGTIGDIGCFSFFSNKNISTGEGGMLVTNNDDIAAKAKLLRSHGMTSASYDRARGHSTLYDVVDLGYNYRMDDMRSTLGIVQLNKLSDEVTKRAEIRKLYISLLGDNSKIIIPFRTYDEYCTNYIFPIVVKDSDYANRAEIRGKLHDAGIQTSVHYPPVHKFEIYKTNNLKLPLTEYASDNLITLPMYSKLQPEQIEFISNTLNRIL